MNLSNLTKVAQSSRASDLVFKYLAGRERSSWNLNLVRVYADITADGATVSREQFNAVFEALEKAGAGAVIHGRRGGATRFVWNYSFRDAASRTLNSIQAKSAKPVVGGKAAEMAPTVIQISLPSTVSQSEIKALLELAKSISK